MCLRVRTAAGNYIARVADFIFPTELKADVTILSNNYVSYELIKTTSNQKGKFEYKMTKLTVKPVAGANNSNNVVSATNATSQKRQAEDDDNDDEVLATSKKSKTK